MLVLQLQANEDFWSDFQENTSDVELVFEKKLLQTVEIPPLFDDFEDHIDEKIGVEDPQWNENKEPIPIRPWIQSQAQHYEENQMDEPSVQRSMHYRHFTGPFSFFCDFLSFLLLFFPFSFF